MAKDGTARGGPRIGAGRKKKTEAEKALEGRRTAGRAGAAANAENAAAVPEVAPILKARQKKGMPRLNAKEIFKETWLWLEKKGCAEAVGVKLVEQYAMSAARWEQLEQEISRNGFTAAHPTTGAEIASPFVSMSMSYMKQCQQCWYAIYQVVRESGTGGAGERTPQDELMERLLGGKG